MVRRSHTGSRALGRAFGSLARSTLKAGAAAFKQATRSAAVRRRAPPSGIGDWVAGVAVATAGARRFQLFKPRATASGERLPLLVMLHGCGQDAAGFATSTRMNRVAGREGFFVLYLEQDRLANLQGCWNWYGTRTRQAYGEAAIVMAAIDQVCRLYPVDKQRIALAGMSAGASMAALIASRHPDRFKAVVMHSGIPPGAADSSASALGAMRGQQMPVPIPTDQPLPALLVVHGSADRVVAPSNARDAVRLWAEAAGAKPAPSRRVRRGKRHPMTVTEYRAGGRAVATLCEVDDLAHAWSGGDSRHPHGDDAGPDASRMVWAFAARQFTRSG